jgi:CubicO group peptidase (beta-lactamase class C family)
MKKLIIICAFVFTSGFSIAQLYFPPSNSDDWETILPESLNWCQNKIDSLYDFLDSNNTNAFILLKDGKIVLEKYFGSHNEKSLWYWASAGKTLTSFMVGVAQQEGYLSISDTTSKYLGEGWTNCTPDQEYKITIRHQLTMTTGLDDGIADNFCTDKSCLIYKAGAGTRWAYHNAPYTLLDQVVETATGVTLNNFIDQKLKPATGITGLFIKLDYNNVFWSNARSMARFGLLILNKGNWNGTQIMTDTTYFNQMINTSQSINESYGYLWWLNGKSSFMVPQSQIVFPGSFSPNAPDDMIAALGKNGQFIDVVPSENLVWIRMGEAPETKLVSFLLNDQIWEYLNELECTVLSVDKPKLSDFDVYPNPVSSELIIESPAEIKINTVKFSVYNPQGKLIKKIYPSNSKTILNMTDYPAGTYFISINNGKKTVQKKFNKN